ncbi:unnamed protein product [Echinostoma caproni]|uniref:Multidrug resistance protein NorM n=1 Tax=Echinostoma caproni TaxID=27848 RepID=A0A183AW77_9TREM|nr:unnamed protein product [Echinostoma caproni]
MNTLKVLLIIFLFYSEINFSAALKNWGIIFRMGIPGVFMVALEEWCFEALTFVAGSMGEVTLGAHAIAFQIQSIIYMVPLGIFTAVNVRVGQRLGAFDPIGGRFAYRTALGLIPFIAMLTGGPVILLRHHLPYLFTQDP